MTPFFITGFPRSRTAWFAVWLSAGASFCYHDALAKTEVRELRSLLKPTPQATFVGDSDTVLLLCYETVLEMFPAAPWVLVHRPRTAARASYEKHFPNGYPGAEGASQPQQSAVWDRLERNKEHLASQPRTMNVNFADLDNEETARKLWRHLLPQVPFDPARWRLLNGLRVNVIPEKLNR